jgi:dTDP-4-dehydrorhamnose 3,5-epimerase-like enzyme
MSQLLNGLFGSTVLVHSDFRREIFEFNGEDFSIQRIVIGENKQVLGNHYHEKKWECFYVQSGQGVVSLCDVNDSDKSILRCFLHKGSVLKIKPYTAHKFEMEPGSELICFSSTSFNADDKDMIPYSIPEKKVNLGDVE